MGHNKQEMDEIVSTEPTWHHLERLEQKITFPNSGLNYNLLQEPLEHKGVVIPEYQVIRCSDNDKIIHCTNSSWKPIQPERIFQLIETGLSGVKHKIVSSGSVGNRATMFVSVEIEELEKFTAKGYKNMFNFVCGNKGNLALIGMDSSIKMVCQNTINASLAQKHQFEFSVRHTCCAEMEIQEMGQVMQCIADDRKAFYDTLSKLQSEACNVNTATKLFTGFLTKSDITAIPTRTTNRINRLVELFSGAGKGCEGKTRLDALDAVTDLFSHESSGGKDRMKQFVSSEFTSGANAKVDFFHRLTDKNAYRDMLKRGETNVKLLQPTTVAVGGNSGGFRLTTVGTTSIGKN